MGFFGPTNADYDKATSAADELIHFVIGIFPDQHDIIRVYDLDDATKKSPLYNKAIAAGLMHIVRRKDGPHLKAANYSLDILSMRAGNLKNCLREVDKSQKKLDLAKTSVKSAKLGVANAYKTLKGLLK